MDCEDHNPCTVDVCLEGECYVQPGTGLPCDDGDPCTLGDACVHLLCEGGPPIECDDGDPCTSDRCEEARCRFYPEASEAACDDGDPCTEQDRCGDDGCAGSAMTCDDGDPCTADLCVGGECRFSQEASEAACDDGDPCTEQDRCGADGCEGSAMICDDGDPCTADSCAGGECRFSQEATGEPCDDGDPCTEQDSCGAAGCAGGAMACDDGDPCTADLCVDGECRFSREATGEACDDGDPCTDQDSCRAGGCEGTVVSCGDDGDPCTASRCEGGACVHDPSSGAPCDDGDPCTEGDVCVDGSCAGASASCDDGDPCTEDSCEGGQCRATAMSCDDGNACTDDACVEGECVHTVVPGKPCDDTNACTVDDICTGWQCIGAAVDCEDGNDCTFDICFEEHGCVATPGTGQACDDDDPCTEGDACSVGVCVGVEPDCSDVPGCSTDGCAPTITAVRIGGGSVGNHFCALKEGVVRCWGNGDDGQLGDGQLVDRSTPVSVLGISTAVSVAAGREHTCAVLEDRSARCWGQGYTGQLGHGSYDNSFTPVAVQGLGDALQLCLGQQHSCALRDDGSVWCWGANTEGQLGNGSTGATNTPVRAQLPAGAVATAIACARLSTCASTEEGQVFCWGDGAHGTSGAFSDRATPALVYDPATIAPSKPSTARPAVIQGNGAAVCVTTRDGRAYCWGSGWAARFREDEHLDKDEPTRIPGIEDALAASLGEFSSYAVTSAGQVMSWGGNDSGQLGNGEVSPFSSDLSLVAGITTDDPVAATERSACAFDRSGTIYCWGDNQHGQLGDGSFTNRLTPVAVVDF